MTTTRPYDYPGAPLHVTGRDNLSVELAYGTDDVELTFDVDAATWADRHASRETYLRISREDWQAGWGGPMTEPNRTVEAKEVIDRLRDERDRLDLRRREGDRLLGDELERVANERDEARRVAGVLADALRNNAPCYCDHPLRAGLPPCSRCSALAVFDTLTEGG